MSKIIGFAIFDEAPEPYVEFEVTVRKRGDRKKTFGSTLKTYVVDVKDLRDVFNLDPKDSSSLFDYLKQFCDVECTVEPEIRYREGGTAVHEIVDVYFF